MSVEECSALDEVSDGLIWGSELTLLFLNPNAFLPYHMIVSPRRPVRDLPGLTRAEQREMFCVARLAMRSFAQVDRKYSFTLLLREAEAVETGRLAMHVVPRMRGDVPSNDVIYHKDSLRYGGSKSGAFGDPRLILTFVRSFIEKSFRDGL